MLGEHAIKTWSSTQSSVSLSSGEAEFYGVIKGAGMGLGFQSLLADLGLRVPLRVWTDSSAAIGICSRQGLGKMRHIDTHLLWIQQAVRSRRVDLRKIAGDNNPADLYTKHLASRDKVGQLVALMGCRYRTGRAETAPLTRRTGSGKKVIAEADAWSLETVGETEARMPHLDMDQDDLDRRHPTLSVPHDVDDGHEDLWDSWDKILQRGLEIVADIQNRMSTEGRRRCELEDSNGGDRGSGTVDNNP